jgi:thioredoxin reductase/bacterioferritin-associated ferredoxin
VTAAFDAIVIGAGPAGAEAALSAAGCGRSVALIDEQPVAGGQVWRAPMGGFAGGGGAEARAGDTLRQRLTASSVGMFFGHRVWSVTHVDQGPDAGFRVDALGSAGNVAFLAPSLVVAAGAHERVIPFPGWTLPGVIGLAAVTILLKSQGMAPGKRIVVAGCGPLLFAVAAGLLKAGVQVLAVADIAHRGAWLQRLPAILGRPALAARGAGWAARTLLAGVPLLLGHGVRRAAGDEQVRRVVLGPVDASGAPADGPEQEFDVDCLVVGHGLTTACEITRVLRAKHRHDRERGGWVPVVDAACQTSIRRLYAVGDGAGIRGQQLATLMGRRVGLDLGSASSSPLPADAAAEARMIARETTRAIPFSDAMAGLMAQRPAQVSAIAPDTVVCRCEDVTRGEIDAAMTDGAREINQLKHFTRCGMGPCQGRYCADTVEELMAQTLGMPREAIGQWTGRPPLRPVGLGELIGSFDYDDIPIPEPAPL